MNATLERFLQYLRLERNLSPRTVDRYGRDLRQWVDYLTGGNGAPDLASVTAGDIRSWLISRSSHGDSPATLRVHLQAIRALYRYLLRQGEVAINPAAIV